MKTITVNFPPELYSFRSITSDGVKYINDNFKYEESAPASPNHEQSKSAQDTTGTGCHEYCTTAAAGKQEVNT